MTYQELRQKYPVFIYDKYEYENLPGGLDIRFYYSIPPDHKFTHKISISNDKPEIESAENLIFHLGLSLIPSYWKTTCSPVIEIRAGGLNPDQTVFWKKLFIKGMGEYFYKNRIDFTTGDFLRIINASPLTPPATGEGKEDEALQPNPHSPQVLVPIGGGKDSIVTLELLKPRFQIVPFVINPVPVINDVIKTSGLKNPVVTRSEIDPYLLELNRQGYLNGHVPVSAFYAFCAILTAYIKEVPAVAFSDERSSEEGNVEYLGHTINHQYSKTLEFETDLSRYIATNLTIKIQNFSFLRPLYELQITKLFCNYPRYFNVFSSCNRNFKLIPDTSSVKSDRWCGKCPKCVSTALMLACFTGKEKVTGIMGSYPPDLPENRQILDELLGNSPAKPFECVLSRSEAKAAYTGQGLDRIFSSWMNDPNLPEKFTKILKSAL